MPHLLFFIPDSFRGDVLGHAGNPAAVTPNLDRLVANDSVSFVNAFSQNPVCTPSRCAFMTGWYPHVAGHRTMLNMLKTHEPMLLKNLMDWGYHVWWVGKNDLVSVGNREDYLEYCSEKCPSPQLRPPETEQLFFPEKITPDDPRFYSFYQGVPREDGNGPRFRKPIDDWYIDKTLELIADPPEDKPLCLFLPIGLPHPPYKVEEEWYKLIDPEKLPPRTPEPDSPESFPKILRLIREYSNFDKLSDEFWKELRTVYYAMCARVDGLFGKVVGALEDKGIYDDTAIFFFSDHGDFTGDYGLPEKTHATLQDCLVNVPLVIKPPKDTPIKPGIRKQLVELTDFIATVEDITGRKCSHPHFGKSLSPLFEDINLPHRDAVFAEVGKHPGEDQAMNSEVVNIPPEHRYWAKVQASLSSETANGFSVMVRNEKFKYIRRAYETDEFYSLEDDPRETCNLIANPAHQKEIAKFKERLLDFYMRTADVVPYEQDSRQV